MSLLLQIPIQAMLPPSVPPADPLSALSPEQLAAVRQLVRDEVSAALSVQAAEAVRRAKVYRG